MDVTQIILIVFIVLLIIIYPIMMVSRNKKENQKMQEQTNSLKKGDKVLTTSGVYGTIIDLHFDEEKKVVTIETGEGSKKGYLSVDAFAIYKVFSDEKEEAQTPNVTEAKSDKPVKKKKEEKTEIEKLAETTGENKKD